MTDRSFDNQVKQKMTGHESPVPAGVWEAIEQKKKKRRYPFFWWIIGSGLLLTGVIGFFLFTSRQHRAVADNGSKHAANNFVSAERSIHTDSMQSSSTKTSHLHQRSSNKAILPGTHEDNGSSDVQTTSPKHTNACASTHTIQSQHRSAFFLTTTSASPNSDPGKEPTAISRTNSAGNNNTDITGYKMIRHDPIATATKRSLRSLLINRGIIPAPGSGRQLKPSLPVDSQFILTKIIDPVQPASSKKGNWTIDVSIEPFVAIRQNQELASVNRRMISNMEVTEYKANQVQTRLRPSYSYSMMIRKKINNRFSAGIGIRYGTINEQVRLSGTEVHTQYQVIQRLENIAGGPSLRNDTVAAISSGTRTIDADNQYGFLDIPLSVHYMLVKKPRYSLQLTSSIHLGLYSHYQNNIEGSLTAVYPSGKTLSQQRSAFRTGFAAGFRYARQVFYRTTVFGEPYIRFSTGKYGHAIFNNRSVHQAGIGLGITVDLNGRQ